MAKHQHLTHPPLREALIDLRTSEELSDTFIEQLAGQTLSGYETVTKIWRGKWTFQLAQEKGAQPLPIQDLNEQFGWRYDAKDGSRVVQFRRDGITYSVLKGYTTWGDAKSSAQQMWQRYCEWGHPRLVTRLAVRYINVLNLPPGVDADLYLSAGPQIPVELPQVYTSFLHRVVIPFAPEGVIAIVTQALEQPLELSIPIVLDIDVFLNGTFAPEAPAIWEQLDKLRDIKNRIFFASVTEKALEGHR